MPGRGDLTVSVRAGRRGGGDYAAGCECHCRSTSHKRRTKMKKKMTSTTFLVGRFFGISDKGGEIFVSVF